MFDKILIANRGESDREAGASAKSNRMARDARACYFPAESTDV
jgi:hypothetical protein